MTQTAPDIETENAETDGTASPPSAGHAIDLHPKPASPVKVGSAALKEIVLTVVYAVLIAVGVRSFIFEPFNIPSASMEPTLLIGDYLFVSKWSYGYSRYSFPFGIAPINNRLPSGWIPKVGDVVVFKKPSEVSTDYIKRVVAMPGQTVQVVDGILHIDGVAVKREADGDFTAVDVNGQNQTLHRYTETLPNGVVHSILEESDEHPDSDNTRIFTVPPGHVFMMGDNRDHSLDSRFDPPFGVGFVPMENLVGPASFRWFSLEPPASFWQLWRWPGHLRFNRFFTSIK